MIKDELDYMDTNLGRPEDSTVTIMNKMGQEIQCLVSGMGR